MRRLPFLMINFCSAGTEEFAPTEVCGPIRWGKCFFLFGLQPTGSLARYSACAHTCNDARRAASLASLAPLPSIKGRIYVCVYASVLYIHLARIWWWLRLSFYHTGWPKSRLMSRWCPRDHDWHTLTLPIMEPLTGAYSIAYYDTMYIVYTTQI